jgi:hypothetical protein
MTLTTSLLTASMDETAEMGARAARDGTALMPVMLLMVWTVPMTL